MVGGRNVVPRPVGAPSAGGGGGDAPSAWAGAVTMGGGGATGEVFTCWPWSDILFQPKLFVVGASGMVEMLCARDGSDVTRYTLEQQLLRMT